MPIDLAKTPSFRLDGKRALVTGGGRGIGLAAASALAQAGAHVTLAARTKSEIDEAAAAIRARGQSAEALALDVTDVDAVRRAIDAAAPFQILVNNAGMNRPALLPDVTAEDFDAIFALNVRAAFFVAQAVARRLIDAKLPGSIINVSSQMATSALRGAPFIALPSTPWRVFPRRWRSSSRRATSASTRSARPFWKRR